MACSSPHRRKCSTVRAEWPIAPARTSVASRARSTTATWTPWAVSSTAAPRPLGPAPTTRTSISDGGVATGKRTVCTSRPPVGETWAVIASASRVDEGVTGGVRVVRPPGRLALPRVAVDWERQPEIAAERIGLVLTPVQPTLLEDRHHRADEVLQLVADPEGQVDAVKGAAGEPALYLVGHGGRRADERPGPVLRSHLHGLAQRPAVIPGAADQFGAATAASLGEVGEVRERRVEVVLPEVVGAEGAAQEAQLAFEVVVFLVDFPGAGLGGLVGPGDHRGAVGENHDVVGVAAQGRGARLDVRVVLAGGLEGLAGGEDAFGDAGGQRPAFLRHAGLEDDRLPLLGPREVQGTGDLEVLADVVKRVQLAPVEEDAGLDVGGEGVVLVGVPEPARDLDELLGPPVPGGVVEVLVQAEVLRDLRVEAGDNVPAGPAAADVVQRGDAPGQVERGVVGRARRSDQADVLRVRRNGRQQRQRLQPVQVVRRVIGVDELTVDDEERIEEPPLGELGPVDVVVDVDAGVLGDAGVLPESVRTGTTHAVGVQAEVKLAGHKCPLWDAFPSLSVGILDVQRRLAMMTDQQQQSVSGWLDGGHEPDLGRGPVAQLRRGR